MNINKCYSHNEEDFHSDYESARDLAVEVFLDDNPCFSGETEIELFEGDKVKKTISQFLGTSIAEVLAECACDQEGEPAEAWASEIKNKSKEIRDVVKNALEKWADETNNQPTFFGVDNVSPITIKIHVDKDGFWEEIDQ